MSMNPPSGQTSPEGQHLQAGQASPADQAPPVSQTSSPGQVPAAGVAPGTGQVPPAGQASPVGQAAQADQAPADGQAPPVAQTAKRKLPQPVLAGLLVAGSFGGIVAIMAGMLAILSPSSTEEAAPGYDQPVQAAANAASLPSAVGPGGPGVPLVAAAPTAPPPPPALPPFPPLTMTKPASSSARPLASGASATSAVAKQRGAPVKISIPAIGVYAKVGSVGVQKSGEIQVPPLSQPSLTGWYRLGPAPGDQGPAIIIGHVNTRAGLAVFGRLHELKRGNKIAVLRKDGKTVIFTVDGIEQVGKATFPTKRVYGNIPTASLRLITCGGVYNAKLHHYTDNVVVYATLSSVKK